MYMDLERNATTVINDQRSNSHPLANCLAETQGNAYQPHRGAKAGLGRAIGIGYGKLSCGFLRRSGDSPSLPLDTMDSAEGQRRDAFAKQDNPRVLPTVDEVAELIRQSIRPQNAMKRQKAFHGRFGDGQ